MRRLLFADLERQSRPSSFQATLAGRGFRQSMGRIGNCIENALAMSLFAHSKREAAASFPDYVENLIGRLSSCLVDWNKTERPHTRHCDS